MAIVGDTTLLNSHNYLVLAGSIFGPPFLRLDGSSVYACNYSDTAEFKLFDFLASPGDTIAVLGGGTEVMIFRSTWFDSIDQHRYWDFGLYRGVPPVMYEFAAWWIRDSVGPVYLRSEPGLSWSLAGACIAGDIIGVLTSMNQIDVDIPERPFLKQNYPNPFNPTTTITYDLPQRTSVDISIYDLLGRKLLTLVNETQGAGSYKVQLNLSLFASGIYIYQLKTNLITQTRKMMLLK